MMVESSLKIVIYPFLIRSRDAFIPQKSFVNPDKYHTCFSYVNHCLSQRTLQAARWLALNQHFNGSKTERSLSAKTSKGCTRAFVKWKKEGKKTWESGRTERWMRARRDRDPDFNTVRINKRLPVTFPEHFSVLVES